MNAEELISIDDAHALLGGRVSKGTLDNWRTAKSKVKGPEFRLVEGRVRYLRASVERFASSYAFRRKVAVLLVLVLALLAASCSSAKKLVVLPARQFVAGERAVHDLVAPRFTAYVNADTSLTESERAALTSVVADWPLAIAAAERAVESEQ